MNRDIHQLQGQLDILKERVDPLAPLRQAHPSSSSLETLVLDMKDKIFTLQ